MPRPVYNSARTQGLNPLEPSLVEGFGSHHWAVQVCHLAHPFERKDSALIREANQRA